MRRVPSGGVKPRPSASRGVRHMQDIIDIIKQNSKSENMLHNIAVIITTRCDLKCWHCLRGFPTQASDFPIEFLDKLLQNALVFGTKHIGLTGGEPYLHPKFSEIVKIIVSYGYTWHFVSNGQNADPYLPLIEKNRDNFSHVTLSLDSVTPEIHDKIRRRSGSYKRTIESIKKYVRAGCSVKIASTLTQKNKNEMEPLINLAIEVGANSIVFGGIIPTPWNQELILPDSDSMPLWELANSLRTKKDFNIQTTSSLFTRGGINFCNALNLKELTFNSQGKLIFCCDTIGSGYEIDSNSEANLAELLSKWLDISLAMQKFRTHQILNGVMEDGFDTCHFCNNFFSHQNR